MTVSNFLRQDEKTLYAPIFTIKVFIWVVLVVYATLIQFLPVSLSVVGGACLSFFLYQKFKTQALIASFIAFYSSTDLTFGGLLSFSGIFVCLLLNRRAFKLSKEGFICICIFSFYLIVTLLHSFSQNIDSVYWTYFQRNIYKEFIIPLFVIFIFSGMRKGGADYFNIMFFVSVCLSLGQLVSSVLGNEVTIYIGYQFTISAILLLLSTSYKLKIVSLFNLLIYLSLLIKGELYFSSQDVMIVLVALATFLLLYHKWLTLSLLFMAYILYVIGVNVQNPNVFLQENFGLEPSVSFKLTQIFLVLGSSDFSSIPWSPRVRLVEFINTFDRNSFNVIFGSGFVSSINESYISFVQNKNEVLRLNDFSSSEIVSGVFYGLHNFSRGILHYGLVYFFLAIWIFNKNHKAITRLNNSKRELALANILIFAQACWNPNIMFIFLMLYFNKYKIEK